MLSILLMFSPEMNISVTADPWGSGLSGLDLPGTVCNISVKAVESTETLLDGRPATSPARGKENIKKHKLENENIATGGSEYLKSSTEIEKPVFL